MLGKLKKYAFKLGFAVMYLVLIAEIIIALRLIGTPFAFNSLVMIPFTWMAIMIARFCYIKVYQNNSRNFGSRPNNSFHRN